MTLVFFGKGLVLEGSILKIEDKQVPGIYIYNYIYSILIHKYAMRCCDITPWEQTHPLFLGLITHIVGI